MENQVSIIDMKEFISSKPLTGFVCWGPFFILMCTGSSFTMGESDRSVKLSPPCIARDKSAWSFTYSTYAFVAWCSGTVTTLFLKSPIFWVLMPCRAVDAHRRITLHAASFLRDTCLAYFSTMNMVAVRCSETSGKLYWTTWPFIPEGGGFHSQFYEWERQIQQDKCTLVSYDYLT
jgi:hypothetical protein